MAATSNIDHLTDKEKETLRLVLRGHDAKSMARALGLSVHTINDRLRVARRKLGVTSSKEAARLLDAAEAAPRKSLAGKDLGTDPAATGMEQTHQSARSRLAGKLPVLTVAGVCFMIALFLAITLASHPAADSAAPMDAAQTSQAATDEAVTAAAQDWLAMVDRADWQASWDAAGEAFRSSPNNSVDKWIEASEMVRPPLGAVKKRVPLSQQVVNAPPMGYTLQRFKTDFENQDAVIETVTLMRENGTWRVVGYFLA